MKVYQKQNPLPIKETKPQQQQQQNKHIAWALNYVKVVIVVKNPMIL